MISRGAIAVLDEQTIAQIAAGEVVERPLSVVKELVENAIDAGARRVVVSLERGGLAAIEVSDDGGGIARGELPLALARHATSKLRDAGGLERISTLGFRGEGLAAIAAVAEVQLTSRIAGEEIAWSVRSAGGVPGDVEPVAAPAGTRVIVRDLFANVPARREYLRGAGAESARISSFLSTFALAYEGVTFVLRHDGREVLVLEADRPAQRRAAVFGEAWGALIEIEPYETARARIGGYVSAPGSERGDRRLQLAFVNDRLLRTTQFAGAWSAAYATYAMQQRHGFGVLFVDVPAAEVDPNVHPTKFDVRFRHTQDVLDAARRAVARTLAAHERARFARSISFAPQASQGAGIAGTDYLQPQLVALPEEAAQRMRILAQVDRTYIAATDGSSIVLIDQHAAHERIAFEEIAERAGRGEVGEPMLVPEVIELDAEAAQRFEAAREGLAQAGFVAEPFGERTYRVTATPAGYGARRVELSDLIEDLNDEVPGLDARGRIWASLACHSVARAGDSLEPEEMAGLLARLERCKNPMHCPHGRPTVVRLDPLALARMFKRA